MKLRAAVRSGFTILELVIVLTVLAVLAGLVLSLLPNLLTRTHYALGADTIAELNKTWQRSHALNVRYPDVYDSLLNSDGATAFTHSPEALLDQATVETLEEDEVDALAMIGIRSVVHAAAGATNTYDYAPFGATATPLADGSSVVTLNLAEHLADGNALNLKRHLVRASDGTFTDNSANTRYVIFGIGPNCSAVGTGKLIQDAPVHFAAEDANSPTASYQRYLVVFSIVNDGGDYEAYFECAAACDHHGIVGAAAHTQEFHEATAREG